MELNAHWSYPTSITVGEGCIQQVTDYCLQQAWHKPFIITDQDLVHLPIFHQLINHFKHADIDCGVYSSIQGNPTDNNIREGIEQFHQGNFDGIIAFGGGSSIDVAKIIGLLAKQKSSLNDMIRMGNTTNLDNQAVIPIIAIPTTAGTGSEVGRSAVFTRTDLNNPVKNLWSHEHMMPQKVFLDPTVTLDLPASLTAATGIDALAHHIEALCVSSYHPMADAIATQGIGMLCHYLPKAFANGYHVEARTQLLVASAMGATAFQKGLGACHALAHTLGALYDSHHGLLNAILLPYTLVANRDAIEPKINALAKHLSLKKPTFDGFLEYLFTLRAQLNIPHTLNDIQINLEKASLVASLAHQDSCAADNPIAFSEQQYKYIFIAAVTGQIDELNDFNQDQKGKE